jgi:cytochrome c peroxidase
MGFGAFNLMSHVASAAFTPPDDNRGKPSNEKKTETKNSDGKQKLPTLQTDAETTSFTHKGFDV